MRRPLLLLLTMLVPLGCRSARGDAPCLFSSEPRSTVAWEHGGAPGELRGRVVSVATGEPHPRALVFLEPGGHRASADSAGRFRFSDLPRGSYEIRVGALGLVDARESLVLGHAGAEVLVALAVPSLGLQQCITVRESSR